MHVFSEHVACKLNTNDIYIIHYTHVHVTQSATALYFLRRKDVRAVE